jgi:hypothetical protein
MKNSFYVVLSTTLFWASCLAYGQAASPTDTLKTSLIKSYVNPFSSKLAKPGSRQIPSAYYVVPDFKAIQQLATLPTSSTIAFDLPLSRTESLRLLIHAIEVVAPNFRITTSSGRILPMPALRFYAGKVLGDTSSTVALTMSDTSLEGLIYGKTYSYTLGRMKSAAQESLHAVYRTLEIPQQTDFECRSEEAPQFRAVESQLAGKDRQMSTSGCRGVGIYLETDYQLYQDWGSDFLFTIHNVTATFANVVTLYAQEDIRIELSELKIWDTPDPFRQAPSANILLSEFKNYWNARGNTFNGDIAHLLTTRISQGGIAYYGISRKNPTRTLDDLAAVFSDNASRSFAFSASTGVQHSPLAELPAYSYNVYLLAHELGHNFGLPHTHSCLWDGGPLDQCGSVEDGSCPPGPTPTHGGTIMSYCPNLANGFGPQPSAKMRRELLVAQSLIHAGVNSLQITPAVASVNQYQYATLEVSHCSGTVLWNDGVVSGSSRTLLPSEPTTYYAACLIDGCLSAPVKASLNTVCIEPAACSVSAISALSLRHGIASFSFATLLTASPNGTPSILGTFYEDFTCTQQALVKAGESYPFTLTGTFGSSLLAKIYIDYNGNGQFTDPDELVYSGLSLFHHLGTITIPSTALRGTPLRMRVMVNPTLIPDACSLPGTLLTKPGKVNDYAITITDPTCPPNFRESVKSGYWNDPLVWSCGTLPTALEQVKINAGHYVTLPTGSTGHAGSVDLHGVIQPGPNSTLRIIAPWP